MKSLLQIVLMLSALSVAAQGPWTQVQDESTIARHNGERDVIPEKYDTYTLNFQSLKSAVAVAPMAKIVGAKKARLSLPVGDGIVETFEFVESPAMSPVLSAKFPSIKSYKGISIDNPYNTAYIDFNKSEFRGIVLREGTQVFIDPYYNVADGTYMVYYGNDHVVDTEDLEKTCGVLSYEENLIENPKPEGVYLPKNAGKPHNKSAGIPITHTTYRLAVTATGLWSAQQGNTTESVLEKINTAVNRLNSLFEAELAVKFELIDDNDKLVFFTDKAPLTMFSSESEGRVCLRENTGIINRTVGVNSYDMGHCFTVRCTDGIGGVANLGSVCNATKGNGVSCVGTASLTAFILSVTAHELGHQFTTGHTWGNCPASADQFSGAQNCEPGSGSTIMSYFGTCGSENLAGPESPVFHTCSLIPMNNFLTTGNASTCGEREVSTNTAPVAVIEDEPNIIPISTPFQLTGDATDMENDAMTYVWEQIDGATIAFPLGSPASSAPMFRTFPPSQRKTRNFPRLSSILAGSDTREERLPTYSRDLNFAFTVRDNNPAGGGVTWETIKLEATDAAGPFLVTSPNTLLTASVNEEVTVEWDVANTDGPEVDCQFVDIYFSDDNAQTFTKILSRTENDGQAVVRMPNQLTTTGKIKVKGADNVFFNISRNSIRVVEPTVPSFFVDASESFFEFCLPNSLNVDILGTSFLGYDNDLQLDVVSGLPDGATSTFSQNPMPANGVSTLNIDLSNVLFSDTYTVRVRAVGADADTIYQNITINATGSFLGDVALQEPADDTRGVSIIPEFSWVATPNASSYFLEISSSPDFADENILFAKDMGLENVEDSAIFNLENSSLYFWRVTTFNDCVGSVTTETNIFSTQALNCRLYTADDLPLNISSGAPGIVQSVIDVGETGTVSDVNVNLVKGSHNNLSDVRASIIGPDGTKVILWQGCIAFNRIDAGFDDIASIPNDCPDKNGLKIRPRDTLGVYIGQELQGKWALEIDDRVSGNGGSITDYELELCSATSLSSPEIIFNEVSTVAPGAGTIIENNLLLAEDENNTDEELVFTMMEIPTKGDLIRNGVVMTIGDQFSQRTINNGLIVYKHNGTQEEEDQFTFIVEDGEGGWINRTNFLINVVEGGSTTAVEDIDRAEDYFEIFPNPASDFITIKQLEADNADWNLTFTANGQVVTRQTFKNNTVMNVADLPSGLYLMQLESNGINLAKKISIIK